MLVNDSLFFSTVIESLHNALDDLRVPHGIVTGTGQTADANTTFVLCTVHEEKPLPTRYIAYNFEQLTTDKPLSSLLLERFLGAVMVWDYSPLNIKLLHSLGVPAVLLPYGFSPGMRQPGFNARVDKDIDIMFVGALNPARESVLAPFRADAGLKTFFGSAWGPELLRVYERSKLSLNLHYFGGRTILEVHRIIPLITHGVIVVSPHSDDAQLDQMFAGLVNFSAPSQMLATCRELLLQRNLLMEARRRSVALQDCCSFVRFVQACLQSPCPIKHPKGYVTLPV